MAPQTTYNIITVIPGLTLGVKVNGLTASLSGSGSARGVAEFVGGAQAQASAGIKYTGSALTFPYSFNTSCTNPNFLASQLSSQQFSVTAGLVAKLDIAWTLQSIFSASFEVQLDPYIQYSYGMAGSSFTASLLSSSSQSRSDLANAARVPHSDISQSAYFPGSSVPISISYSGFVPNEDIILFYSITDGNQRFNIMSRAFITSDSGSGMFDATWLVPWDSNLDKQEGSGVGISEWSIEARCSNLIDKMQFTDTFALSLFTETDGVLTTPTQGEVVQVETTYTLKWDASLLRYFEVSDYFSGSGTDQISSKVQIFLVAEKAVDTGSSTVPASPSALPTMISLTGEDGVLNVGTADVVFPSSAITSGDRFYVVVECKDRFNIRGWSSGYFYLASQGSDGSGGEMSVLSASELKTFVGSKRENRIHKSSVHRVAVTKREIVKHHESVRRRQIQAVSLCNSTQSAILTFGTKAAGGLLGLGFSAIQKAFSGLYSTLVTMMTQTVCTSFAGTHPTKQPTLALPSPVPTSRPTGPTASPTLSPTKSPSYVAPTPPFCAQHQSGTTIINSVFDRKHIDPKLAKLKESQQSTGIQRSFWHTKDIMAAIGARKHHIEVNSNARTLENTDTSDYDSFASQAFHDTTTTYDFSQDMSFFSLDDHDHATAVMGISDDGLLHCPAESTITVDSFHVHANIGDIFIASEHGSAVHSKASGHLKAYMSSPSVSRNKGFLLIRRVVAREVRESVGKKTCMSYRTEDLHPIELFDSFRVQSTAESPFRTEYFSAPDTDTPSAAAKDVGVETISPFPDAPLTSCYNPYWKYAHDDIFDPALLKGSSPEYVYTAHLTWACAQ
jgi:hypothetical protein